MEANTEGQAGVAQEFQSPRKPRTASDGERRAAHAPRPVPGGGPSAARIWILIPALDEEQALPLVLSEIPSELVDGVLVVDNGSRDATAAVAAAAGALVVHEPRRGYGSACLAGLAALLGEPSQGSPEARGEEVESGSRAAMESTPGAQPPADIIVFLDADHSDYPGELERIIAPILDGQADLVIGSRILGGASRAALLPQAWFGNRLACLLMRILFRVRYTDLGPFRAIRTQSLERLHMSDKGFGWTVEMQLKAHSAGLTVREVPVSYRSRIGQSKITGTLSGTLGAGTKIIGWILAWRLTSWCQGSTRSGE